MSPTRPSPAERLRSLRLAQAYGAYPHPYVARSATPAPALETAPFVARERSISLWAEPPPLDPEQALELMLDVTWKRGIRVEDLHF